MMKKSTKIKIYIAIAAVCVLSVIAEVLFAHPHGHEIWHTVPGADIVIAFAGGWVLILFAKKILAPIIQRDENYYDRGDKDE